MENIMPQNKNDPKYRQPLQSDFSGKTISAIVTRGVGTWKLLFRDGTSVSIHATVDYDPYGPFGLARLEIIDETISP